MTIISFIAVCQSPFRETGISTSGNAGAFYKHFLNSLLWGLNPRPFHYK